jgi:plastocyanin
LLLFGINLNNEMKAIRLISIALLLMISIKSYSVVHVINQSNYTFSPSSLSVNVGDVVRWVWSSGTHTTTSTTIPGGASSWDSPLSSSNTSFEYTVTVAGTYSYECIYHADMGMTGSFTATVATLVDENPSYKNFKVFPNPASSYINLPLGMKGKFVISDLLGNNIRQLSSNDLTIESSSYRMDIADLVNGIYIVSFLPADTKRLINYKFIKE